MSRLVSPVSTDRDKFKVNSLLLRVCNIYIHRLLMTFLVWAWAICNMNVFPANPLDVLKDLKGFLLSLGIAVEILFLSYTKALLLVNYES